MTVPDFKGPGQWRSQAVKAQKTAGGKPPAAKKPPAPKPKKK